MMAILLLLSLLIPLLHRGIRLYEPITINGAVVYDLTFDKETAKLSGNGVQTTSSKIDVNVIANPDWYY